MLKLEKVSRDQSVSVIVRDKECLFTRPFLIALSLAFGIHLFLILLFHIVPIRLRTSQVIFPPTSVEAALGEGAVIAELATISKISSGLPVKKPSLPLTPEHPTFITSRSIEYIKENHQDSNPFKQIETEVYLPQFNSVAKATPKPLEMIISGPLANKILLTNEKNQPLPRVKIQEARAIYEILVEGRTGRIFWQDPKQLTGNAALDHYAETVLKELQFAIDQHNFVTAGVIELHFNLEKS